jgi:hypothetical protein
MVDFESFVRYREGKPRGEVMGLGCRFQKREQLILAYCGVRERMATWRSDRQRHARDVAAACLAVGGR